METVKHTLYFNWILSVFLMGTFYVAQATFVENLYRKLEPGQNITGQIGAEHKGISHIECSTLCCDTNKCAGYQYQGSRPGNCLLIHCSDNEGQTFQQEKDDVIFEKVSLVYSLGWREPICWTGQGKVVLYQSFDASGGLVLMEGAQQMDFVQLVSGKVNSALTLDHTRRQWIDLGIHTEVCLTHPETCTAGGAISLWVNIAEGHTSRHGIISSQSETTEKTGLEIYGVNGYIYFIVYLLNKDFLAASLIQTGWTHIVLNYIGPDDGQEIRVYFNGTEVATGLTRDATHSAGDGRIVVGRIKTDQDRYYASMEIDELIFFNKALSTAEITVMNNAA